MKYKRIKKILVCALLITVTGCNGHTASRNKLLQVVTTTTMLSDLAKIIGGDKVNVSGLMGPGVDPHLYQASANDVTDLQQADIVVYNGLHLEGKMGDIFDSLKHVKQIICVENGLRKEDIIPAPDDAAIPDPHIWFSVENWQKAARYMKEQLQTFDPESKDYYQKNYEEYEKQLEGLQSYIIGRIEEIPEEQRVLVTAHDAFHYFEKAYHFKVLALQGISTESEASTSNISQLASFIADHKIKAIFIESSVPSKTVESLQAAVMDRHFAVNIGGQLYSDSLGDKASKHDTYITTFKANIDIIVDALK